MADKFERVERAQYVIMGKDPETIVRRSPTANRDWYEYFAADGTKDKDLSDLKDFLADLLTHYPERQWIIVVKTTTFEVTDACE